MLSRGFGLRGATTNQSQVGKSTTRRARREQPPNKALQTDHQQPRSIDLGRSLAAYCRDGIGPGQKVESVPKALERFISSGRSVVEPASDIAIGRLAVVSDPWNNRLVLLDASKGQLQTDPEHNVTGVGPTA